MRITKALFCLAFLAVEASLAGQTTDFNRVVLPIEMKAKDFREYLVQLAWLNTPDNRVYEVEVENAKDQLKVTKRDWMKDVQVTSNINEANVGNFFRSNGPQTITTTTKESVVPYSIVSTTTEVKGTVTETVVTTRKDVVNGGNPVTRTVETTTQGGNNNIFFPRYNLGINLNLGTIATQKSKNRIKEREIAMAEHKVNQQKLLIRAETLERYEKLYAAHEIYKTRVQIEQDAKANYLLIANLYKTDEKTFDEFNEASSAYQGAIESRIKAESERRIALYRLEEIIGITWELVKHPGKEPLF